MGESIYPNDSTFFQQKTSTNSFSSENCRNSFMIGNTLGNLCWKKTLYTLAIRKFIYLKKFLLISLVKNISGNYKLSSLKNKNILIKFDWNMKYFVLWKFTSCEWILSSRNSSYLRKTDWDDWGLPGLVLILKRKHINNSFTYLIVTNLRTDSLVKWSI